MPDTNTNDNIYVELRNFLDRLPPGFASTESDVDIEYLKWMFTPEEAEVEIHLRTAPEPASVIAKRCGKSETETEKLLSAMAKKGLIFPTYTKAGTLYMAMWYIPGILENLPKMMDRQSAELTKKYMDETDLPRIITEQKQMRVVPVDTAVQATSAVATYDRLREMVKKQKIISVTPCPCRTKKAHLGEPCDRPIDNELAFGVMAQYRIENDFGRKIDVETAIRILDEAEDAALVSLPVNAQEPAALCMCCSCCCDFLKGLKSFDRPADQVQSDFQARIDLELCNECETCLDRCQMDAINNSDKIEINQARCIGCGLCMSTCPTDAISMVAKPGIKAPPPTFAGLIAGIAKQRGLPTGELEGVMNKTSMSASTKMWQILYKLRLAKPVIERMAKKGYL